MSSADEFEGRPPWESKEAEVSDNFQQELAGKLAFLIFIALDLFYVPSWRTTEG